MASQGQAPSKGTREDLPQGCPAPRSCLPVAAEFGLPVELSLCLSLSPNLPLYRDTSHFRLGPTLMTSS